MTDWLDIEIGNGGRRMSSAYFPKRQGSIFKRPARNQAQLEISLWGRKKGGYPEGVIRSRRTIVIAES